MEWQFLVAAFRLLDQGVNSKRHKNCPTYRVNVSTTVCAALLVPFTTLCPTFFAVSAVLFATLAAVWTGPA